MMNTAQKMKEIAEEAMRSELEKEVDSFYLSCLSDIENSAERGHMQVSVEMAHWDICDESRMLLRDKLITEGFTVYMDASNLSVRWG